MDKSEWTNQKPGPAPSAKTPRISTARAIATDPQLWLPLAVLAIGISVLALVK